jgi:hypothetical protein
MAGDTIHLFLPTGKTFTFHGVEDLSDTENELSFVYHAISDQRLGEVRVRKEAIVAWSRKQP